MFLVGREEMACANSIFPLAAGRCTFIVRLRLSIASQPWRNLASPPRRVFSLVHVTTWTRVYHRETNIDYMTALRISKHLNSSVGNREVYLLRFPSSN